MGRQKRHGETSAINRKRKKEAIPMTETHKGIITRCYHVLSENLTTTRVLSYFVSEDTITVDEQASLLQEKEHLMAGAFLRLLLKSDDSTFYTLIEACEEKGMKHLAKLLRDADKKEEGREPEPTGVADDGIESLKETLTKKKVVIVNAMNPDDVVKALSRQNVLTKKEKKIIGQKATDTDKAEALLGVLLKKDENCLEAFVTALENTNRAFLAREIRTGFRGTSHIRQPGNEDHQQKDHQQSATAQQGLAISVSDIFKYPQKTTITRPLFARICAVSKIVDYKNRQSKAMEKFVKFVLVTRDSNEPVTAIMFAEKDVGALHFLIHKAKERAQLKLKNITWSYYGERKWLNLNESSEVSGAAAATGIPAYTASIRRKCEELLYTPIRSIESVKEDDIFITDEDQDGGPRAKIVSIAGLVAEEGEPDFKGCVYTIKDTTGSIAIKVWSNQGPDTDLEKGDQVTILDAKISTYNVEEISLETCRGTLWKVTERPTKNHNGTVVDSGWKGSTLLLVFKPSGAGETMDLHVAEAWKEQVDSEIQSLPLAVRIKTKGRLVTYFKKINK